ncbi:MAG: hypothetical protein SFY92_01275 [Verrucomicrobiae bacterium]|nr:hypothetical protein [Verrucomicrobiae bacterium]
MMKKLLLFVMAVSGAWCGGVWADEEGLTIYNQDFAVVSARIPLDLKEGANAVTYSDATFRLEPDSVILRDPTGRSKLQILEQSYRADPVTEAKLLSLFEGKTINFLVRRDNKDEVIAGKVIRSGYVPPTPYNPHTGYAPGPAAGSGQPIIQVGNEMRFNLPGQPLFPSLGEDTILKPALNWVLQSDRKGKVEAQIFYLTGGLDWSASYNLVMPEKGETIDLTGWVTFHNRSGKTFTNAKVKLMAGDVQKLAPGGRAQYAAAKMRAMEMADSGPQVTEKSFDEFKLYSLARPVTLRDQEMKQVEFVRAMNVKSTSFFVYNGADTGAYQGWSREMIRNNADYGAQSNTKVNVYREFENSEKNGLGIALPKGTLRFYRRDSDGRLEFTGENEIDHTPRNEKVKVFVGNAFDLVGERKRTTFRINATGNDTADETFEIKVRNRKKEAVEVRIVERLYRWTNWEIKQKSDEFSKLNSDTVEFRVKIPADGEKVVTYSVHYWW